MKLLETRHMTTEVILMTWSPKMDILAIANTKPEVILHRLTWQKVWTLGNNFGRSGVLQTPNPKFLTFHPEGLYLAIGFEDCVTLVEVESGTIITKHEVSNISAIKWKSTIYPYSIKDVVSTKAERLESNLSILLIGTELGEVHFYAGAGRLFTVTLKMTNPYPCHVLDMEIPPDFSSVQVVTSNKCDSEAGNVLSLYYFDCVEYAVHGEVLGVFAAKAIAYKRYISAIELEIAGVHENWGIIVEVHKHYLSFGTGKTTDGIKADYAELLVTGICTPELEVFLGAGGREKEAKKFINTLQGASTSLNDALKNIKCNIIYLLRELAEITGYHKFLQITNPGFGTSQSEDGIVDPSSEGTKAIATLRELMSLLYHGAVLSHHTAETFLLCFFNFITLLVNTIHSFNIIDSPELPDEDPDPERVFELLRFKVARYIFEMLELNPEDPASPLDSKTLVPDILINEPEQSPFKGKQIPAGIKRVVPKMTLEQLNKFYNEPHIIDLDEISASSVIDGEIPCKSKEWPRLSAFLKEKGLKMKPDILNNSNSQLQRMLMSFTQLAEQQLQILLKLPVLDEDVPKKNYILNYFEDGNLEQDSYGVLIGTSNTAPTFIFHKENKTDTEVNSLWLYKIENLDITTGESNPIVTTALLSFSQQVLLADFLNSSVFSILCYVPQGQSMSRHTSGQLQEDEGNEPQELPGCSSLCHIEFQEIFEDLPSRPLRIPKTATTLTNRWTEVNVSVPTDIAVPGPLEHNQISHILPIFSFHPSCMALSGPRRVGALLDTTKRVIQLMDMDLESSETSFDLDTTGGSTITEDV